MVFTGFNAPAFAAEDAATDEGTLSYIGMFDATGEHKLTDKFEDGLILTESGTYTVGIGYHEPEPGQEAEFMLPAGLQLVGDTLDVPDGNDLIDSITVIKGTNPADPDGPEIGVGARVKFKDPLPTNPDGTPISQGSLYFQFKLTKIDESTAAPIHWELPGADADGIKVVFLKDGDVPALFNELSHTKRANSDSWNPVSSISFPGDDYDRENGTVVINRDAVLKYTYTVKTDKAQTVTFKDALSKPQNEYLNFVGKLSLTGTVRDENGLNSRPVAGLEEPMISGDAFSYSFQAEPNSEYLFTYSVGVKDADALQLVMQRAYESSGMDVIAGGDFTAFDLANTVAIDGIKDAVATVPVKGHLPRMPRPEGNTAFGKTVVPNTKLVDDVIDLTKENPGPVALENPWDVTYTITANLTEFAPYASNSKFGLKSNVVMTDSMPADVEFNGTNPEDFLEFSGDFTRVTDETLPADFASDRYKLHYWVDATAGAQKLAINFGNDLAAIYTVKVKAQVVQVSGNDKHNSIYRNTYEATNKAVFVYSDDIGAKTTNKNAAVSTKTQSKLEGAIDDSNMFQKQAPAQKELTVKAGQPLEATYNIVVGKGKSEDAPALPNAMLSYIDDDIDHSVFDVTEENLDKIKLNGKYGTVTLGAEHFDLSLDTRGHLIIKPNARFSEAVLGAKYSDKFDKPWNLAITLTTHAFDGKEDKVLKNSATYHGESTEFFYSSKTTSEATSFGNELSVRKLVAQAGSDEFTSNLRVPTSEKYNDEFVYQIDLRAHGNFRNLVADVVDVLPAGVTFLGFSNAKGVISSDKSANLEDSKTLKATYLEGVAGSNGKVVIAKDAIDPATKPILYFKVRIDKPAENVSVVNKAGGSKASVTVTDGIPLSLQKVDIQETNPENVIVGGGTFHLYKQVDGDWTRFFADRTLTVKEGQILFADEAGETATVILPADGAGTYRLQEVEAPAGYVLDKTPVEFVVGKDGSSKPVTLWNNRALELDLNKVNKLNAAAKITDENARFTLEGPVLANGGANGVLFDDLRVIDNKIVQENGEAIYVDMVGEYTLTEKVAPAGYVRAEAPVKFTVADLAAATAEGKPLAVNFENVPLLPLNLNKVDSVTGDPIVDTTARFSLYNSDPAAEPKPEPLFTDLRLVDGGKIVIDEDGTPVKVDAIGFYWLQEDVAPNGYFLAKDALQFEVVTLEDAAPNVSLKNAPRFRLDLRKVDAVSGDVIANDDQALFTLEGVDPEDENGKVTLADDLKIIDGQIVHADGTPVWVDEVGTYWLTENIAPVGYIRERASMEIVVDGSVIANPVDFLNTAGKTYAIGDVVWIDKNRNGRQDGIDVPKKDREQVLPGVTVELYKDGELLDTAVTDENGRYLFDQLGAGEYEIKFVLAEEQAKIYGFTTERADGVESTLHSRADVTTGFTGKIVLDDSSVLIKDYLFGNVLASEGIDPTWDAGVIVLDWDDNTSEPIDPTDPDVDDNTSTPMDPAHPGTPIVNSLPNTGGTSPLIFVGIAGLLIAAGGALAFWRRRSAKAAI
ncbi:LPXTG cell wall anchor domain-containing protein [Leucobacter sp. cx-42]|uniref:SpaA isopeptide-forming pilin-related protein n=1 Tax=unclassified Leucobacter TaxID=2621730 RepID=UPI00165DCD47|nr:MULTISPECIES: SpaA isopeptide-forming pilin-related protein [unclassified Leucobacter]MBC9955086.1 LPXTG cell wall anchor domain-containing protein [Leucobacter sp. cx-42]